MQEFAVIQTKIYNFYTFSLDNSAKMNNFAPVLYKKDTYLKYSIWLNN